MVKKGDTAAADASQGSTSLVTVGGTEMTLISAGAGNGNSHFGGAKPEAFWMTDQADFTTEAFSFTIQLKSALNETRFRLVNKYVDDNNWSYIGYDIGSSWYYQYKVDGQEAYPGLSGMPTVNTGDTVTFTGVWSDEGLNLTVENKTTGASGSAVISDAGFVGLKDQAGKMGLGGGVYETQYTQFYYTDVTIGSAAYAGSWNWYTQLDGQSSSTELVGGETLRQVAAGENNGNTKTDKAYVSLPGVEGAGAGTLDTTFTNVTAEGTTPKYAVIFRYTDSSHWAAVGHDGSKWYYQVVGDSGNNVAALSGVDADPTGTVSVHVEYTASEVTAITINGQTATPASVPAGFADLPDGTIGYLLSQNTVLNVSALTFATSEEPDTDPSPDPSPDPVPEGAKKWVAFNSLAGGHTYGQASGPAFVYNPDMTIQEGDQLTLQLRPLGDNKNFGIFYYYLDDSNWLYIGYDGSSGWYYQFNNKGSGSYPKLAGLPDPVAGEAMELSISLSRETLTVSVNGVTKSAPNQSLSDLSEALKGQKLYFGPMAKGTSVEFADMALNGTSCMDNLQFLVERSGQNMTVRYSSLVDVSGKVVDKDGQPMEGVTVRLGLGSYVTEADGLFTLSNVESGSYTLAATKPGYQAATVDLEVADEDITGLEITMLEKEPINLDDYDMLQSSEMKAYVGKEFPLVAQYRLGEEMFRGQEQMIDTVAINGVAIVPTVQASAVSADKTYKDYTMTLQDADAGIDLTMTVRISVEGSTLTWQVTDITKAEGCADIATIEVPQLNLLTVDAADEGADFAGAKASTTTTVIADEYITFDSGFIASSSDSYLYGILSTDTLSAALESNSEIEGDKRVVRNNGADTISLTSNLWYYERGDANAQKRTELTYPVSELPFAKVSIGGDLNEDGIIDWNDGALAYRKIMHVAEGSETIKDAVNYRIVMNFASMAPNPYLETADNIKKVYLATDGLPQAVMLKGYGNEGHDSANSEYADIAEREGGVEDFQDLIKIAHDYDTEIGIHINAQEAYPESKSFNETMVSAPNYSNGWGWLDQSHVIDKLWDLGSEARWKRLVQLYDRINGTSFYSNAWPIAVGESTGTVADMATLAADAATREDNMDFIYLDVWYQDSWETRRIAEQINSLGWRFSTEFSNEGEYDSTWQHWSTDASYGGATSKGYNSEIIRFIRNDQRDSHVLNWPSYGGTADNPLLGGFWLGGFEGWGGDQDFNSYIYRTFNSNLPTRYLQHYYVTKWENYEEGQSPVGNQEKQITLKNDEGDVVVVTRNEEQRDDDEIERVITLNGKVVLNTDVNGSAYLLPWTDNQDGTEKLYHWNLEGGTTTWQLQDDWAGLANVVVYQLTDQGRVNAQTVKVENGTITLTAEEATPYVVVKGESVKTLKNDFGEANYVVDPGFNGYASGEQLDAADWSGDITNEAVRVEKAVTGDQHLVFDSPETDVSVTTTISGLTAGTEYVAQVYVDNESDAKASITVNAGRTQVTNYTYRSIANNYVQCDEEHYSNKYNSKMQIMLVSFVAEGKTAKLTFSREAGSGITNLDDIRVIEKTLNNYQADGTFTQDFESVAQGLYPFVLGSAQGVTDPVTHLSQLHDPYTQAGWNGRVLDDVIEGEWSLKHHGQHTGIIYQTIPQNFRFEAGKAYTVTFDYQSGPNKAYAMVVGDGTNYTLPTEDQYLATTRVGSENEGTQTVTMQVIGSSTGQTWIGLYSNAGRFDVTGSMGQSDFILDNLVIEEDTEAFELRSEASELYMGETTRLYGANLEGATFTSSDENVATVDPETMVVNAVGGGEVTITATKGDKTSQVTINVLDTVYTQVALGEEATAWADTFQAGSGEAENAVDEDSQTVWHSNWNIPVNADAPATITVDLGEVQNLCGFTFQNRPSGTNGIIIDYEYTVGTTYDSETNTVGGENALTGSATSNNQNAGGWAQLLFEAQNGNVPVRYIQIKVNKGMGNFASMAEIRGLKALSITNQATLSDVTLKIGEYTWMQPVTPEDTMLKGVVWSSSNEDVAVVTQSGVVWGVSAGTATITITNAAGLNASCTVTVEPEKAPTDNKALVEAIAAAKLLDLTKYKNDAKMEAFKKALAEAEALLLNPDATQEQLDAAAKALNDARLALTPVDPSDPETPVEPENPSDPSTPTTPETPADTGSSSGSGTSTGDTSHLFLLVAIIILALGCSGGIWLYKKRQN